LRLRTSSSTLFPYTTLFRSWFNEERQRHAGTRNRIPNQVENERSLFPFASDLYLDLSATRPLQQVGDFGGVESFRAFIVHFQDGDRKSTRLNSSHSQISYAV